MQIVELLGRAAGWLSRRRTSSGRGGRAAPAAGPAGRSANASCNRPFGPWRARAGPGWSPCRRGRICRPRGARLARPRRLAPRAPRGSSPPRRSACSARPCASTALPVPLAPWPSACSASFIALSASPSSEGSVSPERRSASRCRSSLCATRVHGRARLPPPPDLSSGEPFLGARPEKSLSRNRCWSRDSWSSWERAFSRARELLPEPLPPCDG